MPGPSSGEPLLRVHERLPCIKCRYDLQGLPVAGVCPECGSAIHDSLIGGLPPYFVWEPVRRSKSRRRAAGVAIAVLTLVFTALAVWGAVTELRRRDPLGWVILIIAAGAAPAGFGAAVRAAASHHERVIIDPGRRTIVFEQCEVIERPFRTRRVDRLEVGFDDVRWTELYWSSGPSSVFLRLPAGLLRISGPSDRLGLLHAAIQMATGHRRGPFLLRATGLRIAVGIIAVLAGVLYLLLW